MTDAEEVQKHLDRVIETGSRINRYRRRPGTGDPFAEFAQLHALFSETLSHMEKAMDAWHKLGRSRGMQ